MESLPFESEFRAFASAPTSAVEGGLLVARLVQHDTDPQWCRAELARLAAAVPGTTGRAVGEDRGAAAEALVAVLREAGFRGAEDYYAAENSALESVLRRRRGIPITLALVMLGVAEPLGLRATGINFPGHFLAEIEGRLFDPFAMTPVDAAARSDLLARSGVSAEQAFRPAGPIDVTLRMLNNLKGLALGEDDHARALDLTGYQLVLSPDRFAIHVERAELWRALGVPGMARHELTEALPLAPDEHLAERLRQHIASLGDADPRLH